MGREASEEDMPPLQVSEILGTLTTSESMFKFIKKYSEAHLRTFGQQKRVYVVPQVSLLPLLSHPACDMEASRACCP